jgi:phosphate starvation-inducible PhoH-like protein
MKEPNRSRKNEIKSINNVELNIEQKEAKRLIIENQIVIVTGRAGSGKSLVCAQSALDFLKKKQVNCIYNTRAAIEVGKSLGFLPGSLNDKFDPYMEALLENLIKCCSDKNEVTKLIEEEKVKALPIQFIRGKTVDDILIVEEAQNLTKAEMLAILTRLGKTGKIVINGDNEQTDIKTTTGEINGLSYVIELSKKIEEIKWIKLKENHRSDLVGKILDYEYGK